MGSVVYRRLAVTIVADLNVIVAEITVVSITSHLSLSPHRVSQNVNVEIWSQNILYTYMIGAAPLITMARRRAIIIDGSAPSIIYEVKTENAYNRRRVINNNSAEPGHYSHH